MPVVVRTFALGVGENAKESDVSSTLRVKEPYGGGEALIIETLVFDEGQITCPTNGLNPQWGGCAIPCPGTPGERL